MLVLATLRYTVSFSQTVRLMLFMLYMNTVQVSKRRRGVPKFLKIWKGAPPRFSEFFTALVVQGVSEWTDKSKWSRTNRNMQVRFFLKVVLESWDWGIFEITTNFYEILIERPLFDLITFSFNLFLLNFDLILVYFSFACELVWL